MGIYAYTVEMWCCKRIFKTKCTYETRNECILEEDNSQIELVTFIGVQQSTFFKHVMNRERVGWAGIWLPTDELEGERGRG